MYRHDDRKKYEELTEDTKIDNFLNEFKLLCIKHNLTFDHEGYGCFIIGNYNDKDINWIIEESIIAEDYI